MELRRKISQSTWLLLPRVSYSPRSQHRARESVSQTDVSYAASICRALDTSSPLPHMRFPSHSYWIHQSTFIFIAPFWKICSYPFPVILKRKIIHTTQLRIKRMSSWRCLSCGGSNGHWFLELLKIKGKIDYWGNTCKQISFITTPKKNERKHLKSKGSQMP